MNGKKSEVWPVFGKFYFCILTSNFLILFVYVD